MSIDYEKYHGTGNDFVVVDADEYVPDRGAFAREICDPNDGTGADGTLFLALEPEFTPPRVVMTLVQPDGSTAAMCGNGARCAAKWAAERTGAEEIMLDTQAGTRRADVDGDTVTIEMGHPSFAPEDVPLKSDREQSMLEEAIPEATDGLEVTAVNTGVPHAVVFVEDVDAVDLESVAPAIRNAEAFPEGANVTFASPRGAEDAEDAEDVEDAEGGEDGSGTDADAGADGEADAEGGDDAEPTGFDQRTYERGVEGETLSCGTGAVAIAVAARRLGRTTAESVAVHPPGGRLDVSFRDGRATLTGPAVREYSGGVSSTPDPRQVRQVELD